MELFYTSIPPESFSFLVVVVDEALIDFCSIPKLFLLLGY